MGQRASSGPLTRLFYRRNYGQRVNDLGLQGIPVSLVLHE